MRVSDFKKLKETKTIDQIIGMQTHEKINLTDRQLDWVVARSTKSKLRRRGSYGKKNAS